MRDAPWTEPRQHLQQAAGAEHHRAEEEEEQRWELQGPAAISEMRTGWSIKKKKKSHYRRRRRSQHFLRCRIGLLWRQDLKNGRKGRVGRLVSLGRILQKSMSKKERTHSRDEFRTNFCLKRRISASFSEVDGHRREVAWRRAAAARHRGLAQESSVKRLK